VRLLLDAHGFLWWLAGSRRLSESARRAADDEANDVLISAASAWETTTKHRLGKHPEADAVPLNVAGTTATQSFEELPITVDDDARAGALPGPHRDPFDRVLAAQALARDLVVVSTDPIFDRYAVRRLW